jgi:hypothetical protein
MSTRSVSVAVFSTMFAAAPVVCAQSSAAESPWSVAAESMFRWPHDRSYTAFYDASSPPGAGGLAVGRDLVRLGAHVTLGVELNWTYESTQSRVRSEVATSLATHRLQGGVVLRFDLSRFVTPYTRLVAGAAYLDVTLEDDANRPLTGDAWAPQGALGLGILFTSGRWFRGIGWLRGKLALGIEGGYQYTLPTRLTGMVSVPTDTTAAADRLPSQAVSFGTLDASAGYLRATFSLRF